MHPLHIKACALAKNYVHLEGELLSTLMEMAEENLFIKMGFTGMWDYLTKGLKLSESQSSYFQRVAQRARVVPALKDAVVSQRVSLSQARRIVGVLNVENQDYWITLAATLKQKELEKRVAEVSPKRGVREGTTWIDKDLSKLTALLTSQQEKELQRVAHLVAQSLRRPASLGEVISEMAKCYLKKKDPVEKAKRNATSSRTPKEEKPSTPFQRVPIPAQIKHQVHVRDSFRCTKTYPDGSRCESERFLELHHKVPVAMGGANTLENISTLCWAHHRMRHLRDTPRRPSSENMHLRPNDPLSRFDL